MQKLSDYDYDLPEELIAQTPLEDRSASRMLILPRVEGAMIHSGFRDIVDVLHKGDLVVLNNTKVTAMRLFGQKFETGGKVEALLLAEGSYPDSYVAMIKPAKRFPVGTRIDFENGIMCEVMEVMDGGNRLLRFAQGSVSDLKAVGQTPLPPYIRASLADAGRYQTVYASNPGSAAAPTAGLHFTAEVFGALEAKGVKKAFITLDVGIDTFRPVSVENLAEHQMHGENCHISEKTAEHISGCRGRVVAVGTTTVRTLESMSQSRSDIKCGDWKTNLFVTPGYEFKVVDAMLTNFHMPKTTMLCMVSAMCGRERLMEAYAEAVRLKYRFLSFGDAMLII